MKENEHEKKPEAIAEMQKLLAEKDLKIHELKQQLVVSSQSTPEAMEVSNSIYFFAVYSDPFVTGIPWALLLLTFPGICNSLDFPFPTVGFICYLLCYC